MLASRQFKNPSRWLEAVAARGQGTEDETVVLPEEYEAELVMMGLRLDDGIAAARFRRADRGGRCSTSLDRPALAMLEAEEMVEWHGGHLRATRAGMPILNAMLARLIPKDLDRPPRRRGPYLRDPQNVSREALTSNSAISIYCEL